MTTEKQIEIAYAIIATELVQKVFHSCHLHKDENSTTMYPVYQAGREFTYAGIDDAVGLFAYIRTNGDIIGAPFKLNSCDHAYTLTIPLRVVFFNDNESRNHEELTRQLGTFAFLKGVNLVRIITDRIRLVKEESPIFRANFDAQTFYVAFDINATIQMMANTCASKACATYLNPITCPAPTP
jgi:hypothetical protein